MNLAPHKPERIARLPKRIDKWFAGLDSNPLRTFA